MAGVDWPNMADPYEILGVQRGARDDEIKQAFRALAKKLHPDANPGDTAAAERFKAVTAAYDLLSDPERRSEHEAGGWRRGYADGYGPSGGGKHPWDEEFVHDFNDKIGERPIDLFGDIAGNRRGRVFGAASTSMMLPGEDLAETLKISIKDAETGITRVMDLITGAQVEITVAPGTQTGKTITFEGLGLPGVGGGPPGNLNVIVEILPAPKLGHHN